MRWNEDYWHKPKVIVTEGSGLRSGKTGIIVDYRKYRKEIENESGRYKRFDPKKEVAILGDDGEIFTMFKSRVEPYNR